jgi:hypothetical protein
MFAILTAAVFGMPDDIQKLNEKARPIYLQQYRKMLESGELEPRDDEIPKRFTKDSPERRYWLAGYLSALVRYADPGSVTDHPQPADEAYLIGVGAERWYAEGQRRGMLKADRIARRLHMKIVSAILKQMDEEYVRRKKQKE